MKLPRDLSGRDLARALRAYGYTITRETGSHMRVTTHQNGEHHVTIPDHDFVKIGTLVGILNDVATHLEIERAALVQKLFG